MPCLTPCPWRKDRERQTPRKMQPNQLHLPSSISGIEIGSLINSLWDGPKRCRPINANSTNGDLTKINLGRSATTGRFVAPRNVDQKLRRLAALTAKLGRAALVW